jgi:hypothetical protein
VAASTQGWLPARRGGCQHAGVAASTQGEAGGGERAQPPIANIYTLLTNADSLLTKVDTLLTSADSLLTNVDTILAKVDTLLTKVDTILTTLV